MRTSRATLETERDALEAEISRLKAEGECWLGCRLEFAYAGGTARKVGKPKYARLRSRKGYSWADDRTAQTQYVPLADIPAAQAAIARGQEMAKYQKRLAAIAQILQRPSSIAASFCAKSL
jgi:hypothetical protein